MVYDIDPTVGHNRFKEPFPVQFVLFLNEVLQAFAMATPGYAHDEPSRWAYAFNRHCQLDSWWDV